MIRAFALALIIVVGFLYAGADARGRIKAHRGIRVANYRGRPIPVVLGVSLAVALAAPGLVVLIVHLLGGRGGPGHAGRLAALLVGAGLVFLAGVHDDVGAGPSRGLGGHLRMLAKGRVTTGGVKVLAGLLAAFVAALALGERGLGLVVGTLVAAASTNAVNLLDVAPGRAQKAALAALAVLLLTGWRSDAAVLEAAGLGAVVALLPFDLEERAMLGDAGSNLLGYLVGVGLVASLSTWGLVVALVVLLALHVLAETVTLSRLIRGVPPLRWLDDAGRVHPGSQPLAEKSPSE
jgi:UDP-N-acetylmuramyl pentapeptide phosphotransferase/UDP-N-acetylglucosamine-1-phosphate transferase